MVLLYYGYDGADDPLVLDNLEDTIRSLSVRGDMEIVYSANEDCVWGINQSGNPFVLGDSSIVHKLSGLLKRMEDRTTMVRN